MSKIVNEIAQLLKNTFEAFEKVIQIIEAAQSKQSRIDELERELFTALLRVGHASLQDFIESAGDGDLGSRLTIEGQRLKRSDHKRTRTYRSVFGELSISRYVYWVREKPKPSPSHWINKLGLPADEISYVLEDWMGSFSADLPFDSVESWLQTTLGIQVSSSTAHRRMEKLGSYAEDFNQQREPVRREEEKEILVAARRWKRGSDPYAI